MTLVDMNPPGAGQRFLKVTFVRTDGFTQLLTVGSGESVLIGRDLVCDCRLEGRKVSRRHMRLSYRPDGRVIVQDNTSHNGTYVDGVRVMEHVLDGGERLTVGEWEGSLEFLEGQPRRRTFPGQLPAVQMGPSFSEEGAFSDQTETAGAKADQLKIPPLGKPGAPMPRSAHFDVGNQMGGFDSITDPEVRRQRELANLPPPPGVLPQARPSGGEGGGTGGEFDTRVVDMRTVWRWDDSERSAEVSSETIRAMPVVENPIVQRLTQTQNRLDFKSIQDLQVDAGPARSMTPGQNFAVDAVALQLVFQVTEALQTAASMEAFLTDMTDKLCTAARAKAVVVLLPDEGTGELHPRVVKNRRQDEKVQLSRTIIEHAITTRTAIATEDASADERFASGESVLRFDLKAVLIVPLIRNDDVIGAVYLTRDLPFTNTERDLVAALAHLIAMGLERSKLREAIEREEQQRRTLERFHAPDVVRKLMMQDETSRGHGLFLETLHSTILFCDLSGFTRFCESTDAESVGRLLNMYLGSMTEIVFSYNGTVDKYIGDAIMCIFGAPFSAEDDALRAVKCAVEMRQKFNLMMARGDAGEVGKHMKVHIGVNTGPVVAGTVGSSLRMEYTALGDTVNIAARLEGVARAGQIVIGPATAELVKHEIDLNSLGEVNLKGRDEAVEVFEVPTSNEMRLGLIDTNEEAEDTRRMPALNVEPDVDSGGGTIEETPQSQ
jgi:adenylate cyclase